MKYSTKEITDFIAEFIGIAIDSRPMASDKIKGLPLALAHSYSFLVMTIRDIQAVLAVAHEPEACSPIQLSKHQAILSKHFAQPVVYGLKNIESYNLKRLTKAGVNFIVPAKIIYAPCLMMLLRNLPVTRKQAQDVMPPVAQLLVLYHLQKERLDGYDAYRISDLTGMAYTTIIKALKWLETNHIITLLGAKQKSIHFTVNGKELWEKTLPLMSSPIERMLFSDLMPECCFVAGESAMGHYTMLAEPTTPVVAISKSMAKEQPSIFDRQYGDIQVEVWKYNPQLLSEGDEVDKLSLYLSIKNHDDERVQMECETLIEQMKW